MEQSNQFSPREKEVIVLLIQGKTNKEIALVLGVTVRTIEFHLSKVYAKLGVSSRTEAVLILADRPLRESTGEQLRESTGYKTVDLAHNGETLNINRRFPMKKIATLVGIALLTAAIASIFAFLKFSSVEEQEYPTSTKWLASPTSTFSVPIVITPSPTISAKKRIEDQIRQLVTEYNQAVQSEKQNGEVEFSTDSVTGEELFFFTGDSFFTIMRLHGDLWENINQLDMLYLQVYQDELNPTPFPTQKTVEQSQAFYDGLVAEVPSYCQEAWEIKITEDTLLAYSPDDGKYLPLSFGDAYARCETYGQMMDAWLRGPEHGLEKINQDADIALIRQIMGKPELLLQFQTSGGVPNAVGRNATIYTDDTGTKYYIDVDTTRLIAIEPNFPSHLNIPASETKNMDELRGIARQFAITNSPRLREQEDTLVYEENCKDDLCFFRWEYRNKDWSGTDWFIMSPFLQVGVLKNGQITTYNNTLDLFE